MFFIIAIILPLVRCDAWWIRVFEFPRLQLLFLGILLVITAVFFLDYPNTIFIHVSLLVVAPVIYQFSKIIPYTAVYPQQMLALDKNIGGEHIKLVISNVFMEIKYSGLSRVSCRY